MRNKGKWYIAAGLLVVLVLTAVGGLGAAFAINGGDYDQPITGAALAECTAAALEHTGGGMVTESETGDDGAAYGVEVRFDDGSQVEVSLDENCDVIGQEADDDGQDEEVGGRDDD